LSMTRGFVQSFLKKNRDVGCVCLCLCVATRAGPPDVEQAHGRCNPRATHHGNVTVAWAYSRRSPLVRQCEAFIRKDHSAGSICSNVLYHVCKAMHCIMFVAIYCIIFILSCLFMLILSCYTGPGLSLNLCHGSA